jgi:hypothetical protein
MLRVAAVVALAGCFDPHPIAGTPCPDGQCPAPLVCSPASMTCEMTAIDASQPGLPSFSELSGQQWLMPCTAAPNPTLCDCADATKLVTVGGTPGVTYTATVRIRGVVERGTYASGSASGMWYVGGAAANTFLTVGELTVSSPAQHYFINNIAAGSGLQFLDYQVSLPIDGGATVTLFMSGLDARCVADSTTAVIAGVTTTPSPYLGQFAQIDIVQVTQ